MYRLLAGPALSNTGLFIAILYFPVESLAKDSSAFGGTICNYGRKPLPGEEYPRAMGALLLMILAFQWIFAPCSNK